MKLKKIFISVAMALGLAQNPTLAQFDPTFELNDLNGQNGFTINGVASGDSSGHSVSAAGDVNGDGIDDVIIGASTADPGGNTSAGSSYVVFGSDNLQPNQFDLATINGLNGFAINGTAFEEHSGHSVSAAGDVNGDGIDDVIIGAIVTDGGINSTVGSYVVFGSDSPLPHPIDLTTLDGTNGFTINGVAGNDFSGRSVSAAGDINGDGIDDLIIGDNSADPDGNNNAGSSFVIFGSDNGLPNPFNLSSLDGTNGFNLNGVAENDFSGRSVSAAGDVNGDGIDDVIIGANLASPVGVSFAGSSYVVFGSNSGLPNPFNLSSLDGTNGFTINGVAAGDRTGRSVSAAGDINDDGIDDLIISAHLANPGNNISAGSNYVVFGSDNGFANPFNLSTLNGSNGFTINGKTNFDFSGRSVSSAGDVNGDGIDDLIIGADGADPNGIDSAGSTYVVFGSDSSLPNPFNLSSLDGTNGFTLNGVAEDDLSGRSVSSAGDVNGDGIGDLIIGASEADPGGNNGAGSSYVVFGKRDLIFEDGFE